MRILTLAIVLILVLPQLAWAVAVDNERLADPALEARARAVSKTLRCLVCQNQSIEDSNAALARDLRRIVRERIVAGDSDDQVRDYLVARYGDWVLLKPPVKMETLALWIGPFVFLALGGIGLLVAFKRRAKATPSATAPAPLSTEEQARLEALLKDEG